MPGTPNQPNETERLIFHGYNILPAVNARRMLLHETHPMAELDENVFQPTQEILQELAQNPPARIELLNSIAYSVPGIGGKRVNVDLVTPDKTVYYVGTVADAEYAKANLVKELEFLSESRIAYLAKDNANSKNIATFLRAKFMQFSETGPFVIKRNWYECLIPVDTPALTYETITSAIRMFMAESQLTSLETIPIGFLKKDDAALAVRLTGTIDELARSHAEPLDEEQRQLAMMNDILKNFPKSVF